MTQPFDPIASDEPTADPTPSVTIGAALDWLTRPRWALPLITLCGTLLYLLNLGGYPLYTKGEPREAVTIFDIVNGGGVILPMRAGVELPSKPLLMHWLAALVSVLAGGVNEWTVRLPSALLAIAGMVLAYLYLRRLFDERTGLIAALMLGTTFQYLQAGTGARVDMTLTFFMEVAFFEFLMIAEGLRTRTSLLYLAMALAVLTKGPIGAALPVLVATIWLVLYRRFDLLPQLQIGRGALIVGIIGGGWYLAAIFVGGSAFVHKQLLGENLYRLIPHAAAHEGHAHSFYYEEGALLAGFMPWSPFAALAALQCWRVPRPLDRRFGYLLIWALTVLLFYNLPQSKRGVYLLAIYPAACAIIALILCDAIADPHPTIRWARQLARLYGAAFAALGLCAAIGLGLLGLWPERVQALLHLSGVLVPALTDQLRAEAYRWCLIAPLVGLLIGAAAVILMSSRVSVAKLIIGVVAGFTGLALAINLVVEPAIAQTLALKQFAAAARQVAGASPVGYFGNLDYDFAFYNGRDLQLTTPLDANGPQLLVSPEDDWRLVPPRLSVNYKVLLRSNPTDLDGSGRMLLLRRLSAASG